MASLTGWRFEGKEDTIDAKKGWTCSTHDGIAPEKRYAIQDFEGKAKYKPEEQPWPNGVHLTVQGAAPTVTLKLTKGDVKFAAADIRLGEPKTFLDGQVRIERLPEIKAPRQMINSGYAPTARAGQPMRIPKGASRVKRIGHGVMGTPKLKETIQWFRDTLGLICSDDVYAGEKDHLIGSFNRCDRGDDFVDHFAATREWEWRQWQDAVTDWEMKRYFEII